jgi:predicted RNA binding protein YcfA (HicA-like mRNA interferase family)
VRQTGSHLSLTRDGSVQHHITIPAHDPLKIGTLAAILSDVTDHLQLDRDKLIERLFG